MSIVNKSGQRQDAFNGLVSVSEVEIMGTQPPASEGPAPAPVVPPGPPVGAPPPMPTPGQAPLAPSPGASPAPVAPTARPAPARP
ncbi:Uncharacterised protein [Mycobacteroides abscessus subsp. abscessus]|nr:Uncharacterised protein [Mycobacteroides abscessus subsp. abscessus]